MESENVENQNVRELLRTNKCFWNSPVNKKQSQDQSTFSAQEMEIVRNNN